MEQQPDWDKVTKQIGEAAGKAAEAFKQVGRTLAAQSAMGWAYRGDLQQLQATLGAMTPEHVAELSSAAALLTSACDEDLRRRTQQP
ncbi:hypothetical protein ACQP1V_43305 (plasmid) [Microtetraspora malaysiensis]|uniref:hypothetical protein n=1 Tax=Microtetraspora malaysiensis TaxID=161358 RepID=UPI003D8B0411